jgi:hypothetical protein
MPTTASQELTLVPLDTPPSRRECDRPEGRSAAGPGWWDSSWDLLRGLEVREDGWEALGSYRASLTAVATVSPSASTAIA